MDYPATRRRRVLPEPSARPRRILREDEFAPYEGDLPIGSFGGDASMVRSRAVMPPRVRPPAWEMNVPEPEGVSLPPSTISAAPAPLVIADKRGRPRMLPLSQGEDLAGAEQYRRELEAYQPRKRSRFGHAVQSGLSGRGFLQGLLGAVVDPTIADKEWQQRELATNADRLGTLQRERRGVLQDELLGAQVVDEQESAAARKRVRPELVEQMLPDGTKVLVPKTQGIITDRPRPTTKVQVMTDDGTTYEVTPEAALAYKGARTKEELAVAKERMKGEVVRQSITEAQQAEQNALVGRNEASKRLTTLRQQLKDLKLRNPDGTENKDYHNDRDVILGNIDDASDEVNRRQAVVERAAEDGRKARAAFKEYETPPTGNDPQVKAYADKFFGGDYNKALSAIQQQRRK